MALSFFAITTFTKSVSHFNIATHRDTPDGYMINATYRRTNEQGQQEIALFSPNVVHFEENNRSIFQNPRIEVSRHGQRWLISANEGKGLNGAETFYLNDHVVVKQLPSAHSTATTLLTKSLTVYPKQELIKSKEFVTIEQPGIKASGTGLRANLKDGNIELLSKTKGQYDPTRQR